jgi:ABC-type multidrug transport system fused ATPase/permease subunit
MLMDALRRVGLESIAERSDLGLNAPVGDDGVLLSGGQRQRLAWARALLADPEILLLDEPTSSVDSRTEQVLQEALRETTRNRTVIVVAHRLATVADSDQIIVIEAGRVIATGTHAELLVSSPLYRELASHQLLV